METNIIFTLYIQMWNGELDMRIIMVGTTPKIRYGRSTIDIVHKIKKDGDLRYILVAPHVLANPLFDDLVKIEELLGSTKMSSATKQYGSPYGRGSYGNTVENQPNGNTVENQPKWLMVELVRLGLIHPCGLIKTHFAIAKAHDWGFNIAELERTLSTALVRFQAYYNRIVVSWIYGSNHLGRKFEFRIAELNKAIQFATELHCLSHNLIDTHKSLQKLSMDYNLSCAEMKKLPAYVGHKSIKLPISLEEGHEKVCKMWC